jgi:hypothetical protein
LEIILFLKNIRRTNVKHGCENVNMSLIRIFLNSKNSNMPMKTPQFFYQEPFPLETDDTAYYQLTDKYVKLERFNGHDVLVVDKEALELLAARAMKDVSFMIRTEHALQIAAILKDSEASENDKYVAITMLRNAEISAKGLLPFCQDTGTATVYAKKGQAVWTGGGDEESLSKGIFKVYTEENLRYSQTIPLICTQRRIQGPICLHKLTFIPLMAMNTIFCLLLKVVVRPIKQLFSRKRKPCLLQIH